MRSLKAVLKVCAGALPLTALLILTTAHAQSPDAVADLAARINHERITRGLPPYALNAQLTSAAQAHAEDVASTGNYGHIGSDGSTVFDRAARSGFGSYSWGRRLGENWAWYKDAAAAMSMWMSDAPHRNNILHPLYREMGIGIVPTHPANTLFVVDFGAEPNVLPVFIDDDASVTSEVGVMLTLTNEGVAPAGDGPKTIGRATDVQISNSSSFQGVSWQPFAPQIQWLLSEGAGAKTIYVKFRDAQGRTATSSDSIVLNDGATCTPPPTATATRRPRPTTTSTSTATATATTTESPTAPPSDTATAEPTGSLTATWTSVSELLPAATPTVASPAADTAPDANPVALGTLGLVVMVGVLVALRHLVRRA